MIIFAFMKKILAIVNPIAGKKKKIKPETLAVEVIQNKADIEWLYWQSAEMDIAQAAVEKLSQSKFDIVAVFGGDGTVNRIARVLVHRPEALLIIPMGSGNGLARHLKIPMNYASALRLAIEGKTTSIDAAKMNNETFFCTAGLGFDAFIAYRFAHAGKRGYATYIKTVFKEFFRYKSQSYIISFNNDQIELKAFFITIANANQWGNDVKVAPHAKINDGLLELIALKPFKWIEIPMLVIRLFSNSFHRSCRVENLAASKITIKTKGEQNYAHFDGEPFMIINSIEFINLPQALKVIVK